MTEEHQTLRITTGFIFLLTFNPICSVNSSSGAQVQDNPNMMLKVTGCFYE